MVSNVLISVIVPVYRVEKYLRKCVESILAQTYKNLEVILVDDGSDDTCPQICDEYAELDDRVKVIHKQNGGLMSAWISGVQISTGEFIGFVDGDDYISPVMYEELYGSIAACGGDVAMCGMKTVDEDGNVYGGRNIASGVYSVGEDLDTGFRLLLDSKYAFSWSRCNKLYKRCLLEDAVKNIDATTESAEDLQTNLIIFENAKTFSALSDKYYNYLQRGGSVSRSRRSHFQDRKKLFERFKTIIADRPDLEIFIRNQAVYFILTDVTALALQKKDSEAKKILTDKETLFWFKDRNGIRRLASRHRIIFVFFKLRAFWLVRFFYKITGKA